MTTFAAIQYNPMHVSWETARRELVEMVQTAAMNGGNVIVCPELATTRYIWNSPAEIRPFSEPALGPTYEALSNIARNHGCWIVAGFVERAGDQLFNSCMVVGPDGAQKCVYRKMMLFELDEMWATPGSQRIVVSTEHGPLCPAICMDLNDEGFLQYCHEIKPQILAFCTNWIEQGIDVHAYWQHRLWGFQGWFVAANSWGWERDLQFSGRSAIFGPGGKILASAPAEGNTILFAPMITDW